MKNIILPTMSKRVFLQKLKKLPHENMKVIDMVEQFFIQKRGYVFTMPKPKTPVILLLSGGIDSVITWAILMQKFHLSVYPVFIFQEKINSRKEKQAVKFFATLFRNRYPDYFHKPMEYNVRFLPQDMRSNLTHASTFYHPLRILEGYTSQTRKTEVPLVAGMYHLNTFVALQYASSLWSQDNLKIRTIFNGVSTCDGISCPNQSFSALRTELLDITMVTGQDDWQLSSLAFEKETERWIDKADMIRIADALGIPLEKAWSCYDGGFFQCGTCLACRYRRNEFWESGIQDKTVYGSDIPSISSGVGIIKTHLKSMHKKISEKIGGTIPEGSMIPNTIFTKLPMSASFSVQITGTSMEPTFQAGDTVRIVRTKLEHAHKGDVIMFIHPSAPHPIVHRITEIAKDSRGIYVLTKGDNAKREDAIKIRGKNFIGTYVKHSNFLIRLLYFLK
jgi:signal peptidase I